MLPSGLICQDCAAPPVQSQSCSGLPHGGCRRCSGPSRGSGSPCRRRRRSARARWPVAAPIPRPWRGGDLAPGRARGGGRPVRGPGLHPPPGGVAGGRRPPAVGARRGRAGPGGPDRRVLVREGDGGSAALLLARTPHEERHADEHADRQAPADQQERAGPSAALRRGSRGVRRLRGRPRGRRRSVLLIVGVGRGAGREGEPRGEAVRVGGLRLRALLLTLRQGGGGLPGPQRGGVAAAPVRGGPAGGGGGVGDRGRPPGPPGQRRTGGGARLRGLAGRRLVGRSRHESFQTQDVPRAAPPRGSGRGHIRPPGHPRRAVTPQGGLRGSAARTLATAPGRDDPHHDGTVAVA